MTEEDVPNTTFLKSVVIILGILIIGVASLIGVTIYKRAIKSAETAEGSEIPAPATLTRAVQFDQLNVSVPEDVDVMSVDFDSGLMMVTYGEEGEASLVAVTLRLHDGLVELSVSDNGVGLPTTNPRREGMGLRIMDYRARMIGGTFEVGAGSGGGTQVMCRFPLTPVQQPAQ